LTLKYLLMTPPDRAGLWSGLETMPAFLAEQYASLSAEPAAVPGPEGAFSPVEQCRHLADQWSRGGTQEGVGRIALCDLPSMMAEHDASHRAEIAAWSGRR
jgi:hypothetical protein